MAPSSSAVVASLLIMSYGARRLAHVPHDGVAERQVKRAKRGAAVSLSYP